MSKKLFIILTGMLFICSSANADVVCVKNQVTMKRKTDLTKYIKVAEGTECPKGFTKLVDLANYVGPQGIEGIKGLDGDRGDKGLDGKDGKDGLDGKNFFDDPYYAPGKTLTGVVSGRNVATVSLQLPSALEIEVADPEECTGTYEEPTAPEGKVCLYPAHGQPKVQRIPTGDVIALSTKELCEGAGRVWTEAYCAANHLPNGLTPVSTEADCTYQWDSEKNACVMPHYDKGYCEVSLYTWDATPQCFLYEPGTLDASHLNDINNAQSRENCENTNNQYEICDTVPPYNCEPTNHRGEWRPVGCSEESFTDAQACTAPKLGTWVEGRCSEMVISLDEKYSNAGFNVTSETGSFSARWAFTAPDLDLE